MKHLPVCLVVALVGCAAAHPEAPRTTRAGVESRTPAAAPVREFTEHNFGVTFNHSERVTTDYDPHGGADRVLLSRHGTFIGGLRVLPPFPTTDEAQFVESAKAYYAESLKASSVEHRRYANPHGYAFDVFAARLTRDGVEHRTERYMYRRPPSPPARPDDEEAALRAAMDGLFGVFQFEFIAPADRYASMEEDVRLIVDTFKLKARPGE